MADNTPRIAVIGSVNLDLFTYAETLPRPGETVTGATLTRHPGGKGANQAIAAKRLGAEVAFVGCLGNDAFADEALSLMRTEGVDLSVINTFSDVPTAVALIMVGADGENLITVASGANGAFSDDYVVVPHADAVLCQLEIPVDTVMVVAEQVRGRAASLFALNAAPALPVPDALLAATNLLIVNEHERAAYGSQLDGYRGLLATTYGVEGAVLSKGGVELARARPPQVDVVDTTGAGDAFSAALTVALARGDAPGHALEFAVTAGALACMGAGAQPSMPFCSDIAARMV